MSSFIFLNQLSDKGRNHWKKKIVFTYMSTLLSSTSMHFMALPVPVLEPMAAPPTFGDFTFFIIPLALYPWGLPLPFTEGASEFFSVCCFIIGLFTSCLVKELAMIGPWKEKWSFSFLFHTFPGVSTELWVFGPTSWEFQDMNRKPWEGPGIRWIELKHRPFLNTATWEGRSCLLARSD